MTNSEKQQQLLKEKPFIVWFTHQDFTFGMHGWRSETQHFATAEEAVNAVKAPFKAGVLDGEAWHFVDGRHVTLFKRKRAKKVSK